MLSESDRRKAVDILLTAQKERKQAVQLSTTWPAITIEDAYAISTEVANRRIAAGAKLIGHKVGLTSKAMQRSSQIDEPDYGHLHDDNIIADGAKVQHADYCARGWRSSSPSCSARLKGRASASPMLRATGTSFGDRDRRCAHPGPAQDFRHRRRQWCGRRHRGRRQAGRTDGGRPALGRRHHVPQLGDRGDRRSGGRARPSGLGVAWLANKLGSHGVALEPGHLVLAGSFTRVVFAQKGDTLHADFGSLGGIAVQFV